MSSSIPSKFTEGDQQGFGNDSGSNSTSGAIGVADEDDRTAVAKARRGVGAKSTSQDDAPSVRVARRGDYVPIHRFLRSVFHGPSHADFQASQDDPFHKPSDRLIVKRGTKIISHVQLTKRVMRFGGANFPLACVYDLATLPEFRGQGFARRLLQAVECQCVQDGAVMARICTKIPDYFAQSGWMVVGRHSYSRASARGILSYLDVLRQNHYRSALDRSERPLNIRLWRHVEQGELMHLYEQDVAGAYGALHRSESYWRWLISRRGYDRIYVAIDGPNRLAFGDSASPIVGYAVTHRERIVELHVADSHPWAASSLLDRACADAIERNDHTIQFDAPTDHSLHTFIRDAGGEHIWREVDRDEFFMVKVFNPAELVTRLAVEIQGRAVSAGISDELGFQVDEGSQRFVFSANKIGLIRRKLPRCRLRGSMVELVQLLLGHLDVDLAIDTGQLTASSRAAHELARLLFPRVPLWWPPWDELPAHEQ